MTTLNIENIDIEVTKKSIKNIYLTIHPPCGNVTLSAPKSIYDEAIRNFVISKLEWIKRKRIRFKK